MEGEGHLANPLREQSPAGGPPWRRQVEAVLEATWSQERRVERAGRVRHSDDHQSGRGTTLARRHIRRQRSVAAARSAATAIRGAERVQFEQQLREHLPSRAADATAAAIFSRGAVLALALGPDAAPSPEERLELVEEQQTGRMGPHLCKERGDRTLGRPHVRLDELLDGDCYQREPRLLRQRADEHRLSGPRRTVEQQAARAAKAEPGGGVGAA